MNIIIDSTEYKKDRNLNKKDLSLIKDLGCRNLIINHIPWFVFKECTTATVYESKQKVQEALSALNSLPRLGLGRNEIKHSEFIINQLSILENKIENSIANQWIDFIKYSKSILHKFDKDESEVVFKDYFSGNKPFSYLKNRNDIPDAFIYQTIKKISETEKLYIITNDKKFKESIETLLENTTVYLCFTDLFEDQIFKKILETYNKLIDNEKKLDFINRYLNKYQTEIEEEVVEFIDDISYLEFYDDKLKSDDNSATIHYMTDPKLKINFSDIKIIGNEAFVPISIDCNADIDYAMFKADYWTYDNLPKYSEEINKHYFLIEESVKLKLNQIVVIDLDDVKVEEDEEQGFVPFALDKFDEIEII
ncbi:hypothetical protein Q73A0000_06955 [Kaistella flava (ex Peng et al. 2021)]|uniref:DUF4935 domain-containing protein n=1 Tax=Kaistella flava (ex Peng et al. 2021) TaxID=2038776 RepID=A0A7M2Y8Y5_9FLAO|nr:hypothetical protein [Kaistella flava (ex Peng et al. 2021)]QOW10115.1 hypothetical protein Q73A0000_06955 [Kaistella flava (ex Peng et al. 2021)]